MYQLKKLLSYIVAPVIFSVLEHILTPQVFRHGIDQYVHTQ